MIGTSYAAFMPDKEATVLWVNIFGIDDVEIGDGNPISWAKAMPVAGKGDRIRMKGVGDLQVIYQLFHHEADVNPVVDLFVGHVVDE